MKKTISILVACFVTAGLFGIACKKIDVKNLEYKDMHVTKYVEAYVYKKGEKMVLWFQLFDQIDDKANIKQYKNTTIKVDKYPAIIYKDKSILLLVNNRMELRVTAVDQTKDFQNTEKLKDFIKLFDLEGLEKVTGPKLTGKELEKYIPKLGNK